MRAGRDGAHSRSLRRKAGCKPRRDRLAGPGSADARPCHAMAHGRPALGPLPRTPNLPLKENVSLTRLGLVLGRHRCSGMPGLERLGSRHECAGRGLACLATSLQSAAVQRKMHEGQVSAHRLALPCLPVPVDGVRSGVHPWH